MKWLTRAVILVVLLSGFSIIGGLVYLVDYVRDENAAEAREHDEELKSLDRLYSLLETSVEEHRIATEDDVNRILQTLLDLAERAGVDTSDLERPPPTVVTETDHHHHEHSADHFHHHHEPEHFHHHHPDKARCDNAITEATGDCR